MGGDHSKSKDVTDSVRKSTSSFQDSPPVLKYDEWMLQILTADLEKETQMFVVNNMLMSVQFLENYQKEVLYEDFLQMESELNKTLLKELKFSCVNPDNVLETVNQKVRFVPRFDQEWTSAIAPRRLYVVNHMFDVISTFEEHQYTTVDKPTYKVKLEQSKSNIDKRKNVPGYVRLKLIEHTHTKDCPLSSALKKAKDSKKSALTSSEASSESDPKAKPDCDEYAVIIKNNTSLPMNDEASAEKTCLPLFCFTCLLNEKQATDICMQSEEVNGNIAQIKLFDQTVYVHTKGYMRYFKNNIFPRSLGTALGFSEREIQAQTRPIPGKILCKSESKDKDLFECEIIPCVSTILPADLKFSFEERTNQEYTKNVGYKNDQHLYQWPTEQMVKEIQRMPCFLVPKGYWRKNMQLKHANLDWEMSFPKAEKYLFCNMSHTQIRCYLFMLLIHKAYIEPKTKYQGLLVEHITHHIFWECWKNFKDWPEHRIGYKLREVIESLMSRISKHYLPDFFIKEKNLFENISIKCLYIASEELKDVLEQPAMHLMKIIKCLSYTSPEFYRESDVEKLMRMLHSTGLELATPQLPVPVTENRDLENLQKYSNPETLVNYIKMQKRRYARVQQLQKTGQQRENSEETSEPKWPCKKYFGGDKIKISHILLFFAEHFMSLATYSSLKSTTKQTRFFLRQAWYLTKIKENLGVPYLQEEFKDLQQNIAKLEKELYKKELILRASNIPSNTDGSGSSKLQQKNDPCGSVEGDLYEKERIPKGSDVPANMDGSGSSKLQQKNDPCGSVEGDLYKKEIIPKGSDVPPKTHESGTSRQLQENGSLGTVAEISGASDEQVERRVPAGRRNNKGKSVSFLEPK